MRRFKEAVKRSGPAFYRPELDVLRFGAFLLVFVSHLLPRDQPSLAVLLKPEAADLAALVINIAAFGLPLFFFLSAFLITELLIRETEQTGKIDIRRFYIRRCLRIWPLYYFALAIGVIYEVNAAWTGGSAHWTMLAMYALFIGNWYFGFESAQWPNNPMTPLWSISVEEQFYVLWPLLIKAFGSRSIVLLSAGMFLAALIAEAVLGATHADKDTAVWTNTFVNFQFFAYGSLFSIFVRKRGKLRIGPLGRFGLLSLGLIAWGLANAVFRVKALEPADSVVSLILGFILVGFGCASHTLAVLDAEVRLPRLVHLGQISYGLYVFHLSSILLSGIMLRRIFNLHHEPIIIAPKILVALYLCIVLAELSYRYIETPFLKLKQRYTLVPSRPV